MSFFIGEEPAMGWGGDYDGPNQDQDMLAKYQG
jgi:hypothetical protein